MSHLRVAVIGAGHLGAIHARLLEQVPGVELVAVVEPSASRARELSASFDCPIVTQVDDFVRSGSMDAAVLAAPTSLHHGIGLALLDRGVHSLIEKPLAVTVGQCKDLIAAAQKSGSILQVGHVERFNPAWTSVTARIGEPRFIDAVREGPLSFRSMDAGVVLDLMIHDIDLVLSLVRSPVIAVQALGFHWTGQAEDIAQARLTFANGCVARLAASRVSSVPQRHMRIHGRDWYANVDFADRSGHIIHGPNQTDLQSRSYSPRERQDLLDRLFADVLPREDVMVPGGNPILEELKHFVTSIATKSPPIVGGSDGLQAVDIAGQIVKRITQRASHVASYQPPHRKAG